MKSLIKITKKVLTLFVAAAIMLVSMVNVNAASETIKLGPSAPTGTYIGGVSFSYKKTVGGEYLYCLNMAKKTAENTTASLVRNSNLVDGLKQQMCIEIAKANTVIAELSLEILIQLVLRCVQVVIIL